MSGDLVDILALVFAGGASATIGLRGLMLKPNPANSPVAPRPVTLALVALAAAYGGAAMNIAQGADASIREAIVYGVSFASGVVLLVNLCLQRGRDE